VRQLADWGANFIKIDALLEVLKRLAEKVGVIVENFSTRPEDKTRDKQLRGAFKPRALC
jgi:hypothetical protein